MNTETKETVAVDFFEKGAALAVFTVVLATSIGFAAMVVDLGLSWTQQRNIHVATDSAVLAGVMLLVDQEFSEERLRDEARNIAFANQLSVAEVDDVGSIEIGRWNSTSRTFESQTSNPNAVRMSTRRSVAAGFGRIFGYETLNPGVVSVAMISGANNVSCIVPFAVEFEFIQERKFGEVISLGQAAAGNWSKVDIPRAGANVGDDNESSGHNFVRDMEFSICNSSLSVGDRLSPGTGIGGIREGVDRRILRDPYVVVPVVDEFGNGNRDEVTVVGFVLARLLEQGAQGQNWVMELELVRGAVNGTSGGGPMNEPFALTRVLVQ